MSDNSARLSLPYIQPSQAQKHVTHNEALRVLDMLVQLRISGFDAVTPPADPEVGEVYALGLGATGVWAGQDGRLANYSETAWTFSDPQEGWLAAGLSDGRLYVHRAAGWQDLFDALETLGLGTSADATNRLAVAADATLLTHAGAGHQLKLNKAGAGDTASLLLQTGFSGRAEMGLAGNDDWSIKVSPDGMSWVTALSFSAATGLPDGAAVQASAADTTPGRLMRADYGYGPGNLVGTVTETAGAPTGAVIERGSNANGSYTKYADGTMLCWQNAGENMTTDVASGALFVSPADATWVFPAVFADANIFMSAYAHNPTRWCSVRISDASEGYYRQLGTTNSSEARNTRLFAVGRWF